MVAGVRKLKNIYQLLLKEYGEQGWWPVKGVYSPLFKKRKKTASEQFEICIGAILAQNTSWKNAEKALCNLRESGVLNQKSMKKLTQKELGTLIRSAGYYNLKAKKIMEFLKYSGEIEREKLLKIWGCGPETVDSILLYGYQIPVFIADAYARRIFVRLGIVKKNVKYEELREYVENAIEKDAEMLNEYHALLVTHAKKHCKTKPECISCPLRKMCKNKEIKNRKAN